MQARVSVRSANDRLRFGYGGPNVYTATSRTGS